MLGKKRNLEREKYLEVDELELGVRSSNVSISLSVLCLAVALSDGIIIISLPWWTVSHN